MRKTIRHLSYLSVISGVLGGILGLFQTRASLEKQIQAKTASH